MRIQVLGLCRFLFTGLGAFQQEHETVAERQAALFRPARLVARLNWFQHLLLPGIRAQSDPDFTLLVLTGTDLPPWARQRLAALIADVPQVRLVLHEPAPHHETATKVIHAAIDPGADLIAQFRLDDDDAVARDFVARVRADAAIPGALVTRHRPVAMDYARGFVLAWGGRDARLIPRLAQYWTPGMAMLFHPKAANSLMNFRHNVMWQRIPSLVQPDGVMWVRGHHDSNDSSFALQGPGFDCPDPAAVARDRFGVDLDMFTQAMRAGRKSWSAGP
ncbi:glycosyltransferase [Paracoccus sp. p4-l81]|uniref:glycosyltransferase n=1 Tax=Paracoccus sp. p4-l81 TaxID=3342806 RepID=UPI0035B7F3F7